MHAILKTGACWFALLLFLGACEAMDAGRDSGGDQYRLSNHDIDVFADLAFGPNDRLVRWEHNIEFEFVGSIFQSDQPEFVDNFIELVNHFEVMASPVPTGKRPNFGVYYGQQYFMYPRKIYMDPDYILETETCDLNMDVNERGQIEEVYVFINNKPRAGLYTDANEEKINILNCIFKYPFFGAFGGLGVSFNSSNNLSESYRESLYLNIILSAIYAPVLKAGMEKNEAIRILRANPTIKVFH